MTEEEQRTFNIYCEKDGDRHLIMVGPGWVPVRLRPFFDEDFSTQRLVVDLERLQEAMAAQGASFDITPAANGSVHIVARGVSATELATWVATTLASGIHPRRKS